MTQSEPLVAIALRDGTMLLVWSDRVEANGRTYPIAELTGATSMRAPAVGRGQTAQPALGLRERDRGWTAYVPADPPDVDRALQAIYSVRPDLRAATSGAPGSVPAHRTVGPDGVPSEQALLACLAHLSIFFAPFVVPLIIWLALQPTAPYAAHQAKQALAFHVATAVLGAVAGFLVVIIFFGSLLGSAAVGDVRVALPALIGLPVVIIVLVALGIAVVALAIYAGVQTLQGRPFHYPLLGWL